MLPYSEILYQSEWTYPHNVYLWVCTLVLAGIYWNLFLYPASLGAVGELAPWTGCSLHRAAALGTHPNSPTPTALATDKMALQDSNTTLNRLISTCSRTSVWWARGKITEHTAILHPKEQTNFLRHTTLAWPELLFKIIQHTSRGKKATSNSINLFSSNYLIPLSNCRFYVHNLKFHCKATGHNS